MPYVIEFALCALMFLVILTVRFYSSRHLPSRENRLFGIVLIAGLLDLTLDIVSSYTIGHVADLPEWVVVLVNTAFYMMQVIFMALLMTYIVFMIGLYFSRSKGLLLLYIPVGLLALVLLVNPLTDWMFYVGLEGGVPVYIHGPLFDLLFLGAAFYALVSFIALVIYRASLRPRQSRTMRAFLVILVAATLVQYLHPRYLLIGVAITLGIEMMYYTLQDPESMLDLLTRTFNYDALVLHLRTLLAEHRPFGVVAVDVGGIRRVNSVFGMRTGNAALEQIGAFFNGRCKQARAFRMAGTRFLLITDGGDATPLVQAIEERFVAPWRAGEVELMLTATIRYCSDPESFRSAEEVVSLVDEAYAEPAWGTSRAVGVDELRRMNRQVQVENAIRAALENPSQFEVWFQPLYSLSRRAFVSAEALLRLHSSVLGELRPDEFIPIAERAGLIPAVDALVLERVCRFLREGGPAVDRLEHISVNLSAAEFFHNGAQSLQDILRGSGVAPNRLRFEVTETAATVHQGILSDFMRDMRAHGCSFALDDFGTGYANITQVTALPFSVVKLDRSLLISEAARDRVFFEGMLRLFVDMGLETVVEGVETAEQAARIEQVGADLVQGYYFARPMRERDLKSFLAEHAPVG